MKRLDGKPYAKATHPRSLQSYLCRRTGISQPVMSDIMTGKRKPTPKQAALLEGALLHAKKAKLLPEDFSIDRLDMLYCPDGTPLLKAREAVEAQNEKAGHHGQD